MEPLSRYCCTGDHSHGVVEGEDTARSAYYPKQMAKVLGELITADVPGVGDGWVQPLAGEEGGDDLQQLPHTLPEEAEGQEGFEDEQLDTYIEDTVVKLPAVPAAPSPRTRRRHQATHLPYAPWCSMCVAGRSKDRPHLRQSGTEVRPPQVQMDYAYLKAAADAGTNVPPVLVAIAKPGGYGFSYPSQTKGRQDTHLLQQLEGWMLEAGLSGPVTLRCDPEPAIQALAQMLVYRRSLAQAGQAVLETSPTISSSSLGAAERYISTVDGLFRTLLGAFEAEWQVKVTATSPFFSWLVRHVSWL